MSVPPSAQALSAPHRHTGSCEKGHLLLNSKDALICPHDYFVTTNLYSYIVSNIVITRDGASWGTGSIEGNTL